MHKLSEEQIKLRFDTIKADLLKQYPIQKWRIKPRSLLWTKHKTKYGMADRFGDVYINRAFITTSAWCLLDATIRHELAHLYIGLEAGHNNSFNKIAAAFKSNFRRVPCSEINEFRDQISFKYELYAVCANGSSVFIKNAHRKHIKYTRYKPKLFHYMHIKGKKITWFEYRNYFNSV